MGGMDQLGEGEEGDASDDLAWGARMSLNTISFRFSLNGSSRETPTAP